MCDRASDPSQHDKTYSEAVSAARKERLALLAEEVHDLAHVAFVDGCDLCERPQAALDAITTRLDASIAASGAAR